MAFEGKKTGQPPLASLWAVYYRSFGTSFSTLFPREWHPHLSDWPCPVLHDLSLPLLCILWDFCNLFPVRKEPDAIIILGSGLIETSSPTLGPASWEGKGHLWAVQGTTKADCFWWPRVRWTDRWGGSYGRYLMEHGVPEDAILIENRSRTTFENLTFSKRLLEEEGLGKRVLVVTNSFHALRAGVFMRRLKIPGRSIGSRTSFYYLPSAWIRETVGLVSLYWKWHVTFLAFLFLPWFFTQIMKLIEFFIKYLN